MIQNNWTNKFREHHQNNNSEFVFDEDEGSYVYAQIPHTYADIPNLVQQPNVNGLEIMSLKQVEDYFNDILNSGTRIKVINGMRTDMDQDSMFCDYCNTQILECNRDQYYYCWTCHKDMCNLCYGETDANIAKQNGAIHFEQRCEALATCRTHHLQKRKIIMNFYGCYCDLCSKQLNSGLLWSNIRYVGQYSRSDVCESCSSSADGIKFITDNKLEKLECGNSLLEWWNLTQFGSILDWVPLYKDKEYNMILLNCNKKSNLVGRLALVSTDDHGRNGYYTLPVNWTLSKTLETIKNYHENEIVDEDGCKLEGWDAFYNIPIKRLMSDLKMEVHYG